MDPDTIQDGSPSVDNANSCVMQAKLNSIYLPEVSSRGYITQELATATESVLRVELDLACSSEKLVNLDLLAMNVASRENDLETFISDGDCGLECSVEKAFQFDLLHGFLDSEVVELDSLLSNLRTDIAASVDVISSFKQLGVDLMGMHEKLQDCENSLKRSFEQLEDIKEQSSKLRSTLITSSGDDKWIYEKDLASVENGGLSGLNTKIKMQTLDQQRHVLKMLEKSLAREMDIEKKLAESVQNESVLKFRLQEVVLCIEEEAEIVWERLFEAENTVEILSSISKQLFQQVQTMQFELNRSIQREGDLIFQCQGLNTQLKEKDHILQDAESSRNELVGKISELEQKLRSIESEVHGVNDKQSIGLSSKMQGGENASDESNEEFTEAEMHAEGTKSKFKLLGESDTGLNNDLSCSEVSIGNPAERVEHLERQLKESEIKRFHAEASAAASEENNNLLNCTIVDMQNLIKDLKLKVSKAESQIESVEDKCITVSESNAELTGKLNLLRGRYECLETALHQADEAKKETTKDVKMYTKLITDLVLELALERERLHKQISSVTERKKVSVKHFPQTNEDIPVSTFSSINLKHEIYEEVSNETVSVSPAAENEACHVSANLLTSQIKTVNVVSSSQLESVRNIEATQLNLKYILAAVLFSLISVFAAYQFQQS